MHYFLSYGAAKRRLLAVVAMAGILPARRAAKVGPMVL
jgi:hypothetical protein